MKALKSLWASVQGDPRFMRRVNGWLTVFWIAMIPVSYELGWLKSVVYVSALSLWALVAGHWSTWQAARVEVRQEKQATALKESPVEERVVEEMIASTDVEPASGSQPAAGSASRPANSRSAHAGQNANASGHSSTRGS